MKVKHLLALFIFIAFSMNTIGQVQKQKVQNEVNAYKCRIEADADDVLKLDNGAVVQIHSFFGIIGISLQAVLFKKGNLWKIWIEGNRTYSCDLLKAPRNKPITGKIKYLNKVSDDGEILRMNDGSIYEVDMIYTIYTSLWLGMTEVLIINEKELINFNEGTFIQVEKQK